MKMSPALKVGILTILATLILIFGIMWLKGRSISIGEKIEIHFKDVDGMRPGSAVQMMGLRIGQVDEIIPYLEGEDSYVIVRFVINVPNVTIPPASRISVQQSGIIGEKFLEITPPFPEKVYLPLKKGLAPEKYRNNPVLLFSDGKYHEIGRIKQAKTVENKDVCRIDYVITKPEIIIPAGSTVKLSSKGLKITPPDDIKVKIPEKTGKYTIIEPLRMKEFLDIQLKAALALKETNDRINTLFTDDFMEDVRYTVENTKDLSEKASLIVDSVAVIIDSSREDIKQLIASSTKLSDNMTELTANINDIVSDSDFKNSLVTTTNSIKTASEQFSELLQNSRIQESLLNINSTTKDASEIVKYVNNLTKDEEFNLRVEETVVNLNDLMLKLGKITDSLEELTVDEKENIREIINNSNAASKDLKKFSEKLNKRFLLLRLLI